MKTTWYGYPAPTPLHSVRCYLHTRLGTFCATLNGADFLPPILPGYRQRTKEGVESELEARFWRRIGAK